MISNKIAIPLIGILLISGCTNIKIPENKTICHNYNIGRNTQYVSPNGSTTADSYVEKNIAEGGAVLDITNLESTDMVVSYYPIKNKSLKDKGIKISSIKNIKIRAGKSSPKFFGTSGYGRIKIERKQEFFTAQGDGADVKICFFKWIK